MKFGNITTHKYYYVKNISNIKINASMNKVGNEIDYIILNSIFFSISCFKRAKNINLKNILLYLPF